MTVRALVWHGMDTRAYHHFEIWKYNYGYSFFCCLLIYIIQEKFQKKYFLTPTYPFFYLFLPLFSVFARPTTIAISSFLATLLLWVACQSSGNSILTCLEYKIISQSEKLTKIFKFLIPLFCRFSYVFCGSLSLSLVLSAPTV